MKKLVAILISLFVLTSCASVNTGNGEEASGASIFIEGCEKFQQGTLVHPNLETYRAIIEDICTDFDMRNDLVEVKVSENVNPASAKLYVENNVFGLSYWNRYVPGGLEPLKMVILTENDKAFWESNLKSLLSIEPEWFGPTDAGGHCYAAEPEAFCPKAYYALDKETLGKFNVQSAMLGSKLEWTTFRKVTPIHEATHQFHTTTGLGNWRYWYVEGQATYFELASSVLVSGLGASNWRAEIVNQTLQQDELKFNANTPDEAYDYMKRCENGGNCHGFSYFGSSLAHELLVNTFGIEKYLGWNKAIADSLPDYHWKGMPDALRQEGNRGFAKAFKDFFGLDIDEWEKLELAPYVLKTYKCEVLKEKCA